MPLHWPALITLLAVAFLFVLAALVSVARGKYGVKAPATTGNENFERIYRVHMNTLENIVLFLPPLWLMSLYLNPALAGLFGAVWLLGRIWYAAFYARGGPRTPGYVVAILAWGALMIGAAIGVVRILLIQG